jgi:cysteine desulfuration protein SufE
MRPHDKEQQMTARFLPIEDVQERLAVVVDRARRLPPLTEEERCDENRVQGCSSRVWIAASLEEQKCRFRIDADSTLVKGLAALICEIYDGATPAEAASAEPTILESLHLLDHLSPTRRHGLEQVRRVIREFGSRAAAEAPGT